MSIFTQNRDALNAATMLMMKSNYTAADRQMAQAAYNDYLQICQDFEQTYPELTLSDLDNPDMVSALQDKIIYGTVYSGLDGVGLIEGYQGIAPMNTPAEVKLFRVIQDSLMAAVIVARTLKQPSEENYQQFLTAQNNARLLLDDPSNVYTTAYQHLLYGILAMRPVNEEGKRCGTL